ncbi:hypothetical protein [Natrinema hispanicum]|nr:hypothetical protein [Natrinema hispanicum]
MRPGEGQALSLLLTASEPKGERAGRRLTQKPRFARLAGKEECF